VKRHEKQLHSVTVKIHRTGRGTMPSLPPPENENSGSGFFFRIKERDQRLQSLWALVEKLPNENKVNLK